MFWEHRVCNSAALAIFLDKKLQKWAFIGIVRYRICTDTQMINASRANMKAGAYEKDETFFEKKKRKERRMPYRPSPPYSPYLEPQWPSHTQAPSVFYLPSKAILSPVDDNVSIGYAE